MPPLLAAVSAVIEVELPADVRGNGKLPVLALCSCSTQCDAVSDDALH
jgi:hypothetical protein